TRRTRWRMRRRSSSSRGSRSAQAPAPRPGDNVRFLADQSCDFSVVRALRAAGHDVRSVQEERPSIPDEDVAAWAVADGRVVIVEDKDFGYLVHVSTVPFVGVVFLRFPASARSTMPTQV